MRGTETAGPKPAARRLGRVLVGRRRRTAVLLLALAYAAAMLVVTIGVSEGFGPSGAVAGALGLRAQPASPGSVYRSHLVFERLLPEMRAFASRPSPVSVPKLSFFAPYTRILWLDFVGAELSSCMPKFRVFLERGLTIASLLG